MKKIFPLLIVGMLVLSGLGAFAFSDETDEKDILREETSINISNAIIEQNGEYVTIDFEESTSMIYSTGKPLIPVVTKTFTFEAGTRIDDVNVQIEWDRIDLTKKILPSLGALPQTTETTRYEQELGKIDQSVYSSSDLYPSEPYTITKRAGLKNGEHITYVSVRCNAQYSPASDYVNVPKTIDIDIEYDEPTAPQFTADEYDLLIVTPTTFADELQRLVTHKNSIGTRTLMETTENIYAEYDGFADWEEVKLFIFDAVAEYGITDVLLAGGVKGQTHEWWVPEFPSNNFDPEDAYDPPYDETYSCDLYFADLYYVDGYGFHVFDNWDTNSNGIYGEGPNLYGPGASYDNPDYIPDVNLGRIPIRYSWEADIAVDKIIDYESNADDSWFKTALLAGGDGFPTERYPGAATPGIYEGEIVCDIIAGLLEQKDFDITKAYCSEAGDVFVQSLFDIIPEMTKGYGMVFMTGHASPFSMGSYYPNVLPLIEFLNYFNLRKFDNEGKLPYLITEGCHNAQFRVSTQTLIDTLLTDYTYPISRSEWIPHDFSSQVVIQPGGGAIAAIGNTALGWGGLNEGCTEFVGGRIMILFYEAYAVHDQEHIGTVWAVGCTEYILESNMRDSGDRKTVEERVLLGDPSIKLGGTGKFASGDSDEETNEETTQNGVIVQAPNWQTGDKWTYRLDNLDLAISELEERSVDIKLSAGDITVEISEVTGNEYIADISSDNIDVSFEMDFDFMVEDMDPVQIPAMSFQDINLNGKMYFDKETLGINKVELSLGLELMDNLDSIPIELPAIIESLTFITIPVVVDLTIEFDEPFKFFYQFPLEDGKTWGFEPNVITVSIGGTVDSIWLRILNFINKIIPIIPEQFAQFLPVVDIAEVLESFGIPSEIEIPFPLGMDHYKSTYFFKVNGDKNVGSYSCKDISILDDNAHFYYSPDAKNMVKMVAHLSDYIPILEDINLELVG